MAVAINSYAGILFLCAFITTSTPSSHHLTKHGRKRLRTPGKSLFIGFVVVLVSKLLMKMENVQLAVEPPASYQPVDSAPPAPGSEGGKPESTPPYKLLPTIENELVRKLVGVFAASSALGIFCMC
jgi:hypothetical protein